MARSLRKNDSAMLMYSLAVCMRDTDLPPAHAAAVNSFRMSCASFLVGSPMMRDLSGAFSGPDRESVYLGECFPAFAADGFWAHVFSLAGHGGAGAVRWRIPGGGMPAGFAGFSSDPSDRRTFLGFLSMYQGVD